MDCSSINSVVHSGWLCKAHQLKSLTKNKWQRRWFVLRASGNIPNQYRLEYYADESCKKLDGVIDLDQCEQADTNLQLTNMPPPSYNKRTLFIFDLKTSERTYYFGCETQDEMNQWINCICQVSEMKSSSDAEGRLTPAVFVPIASALSSPSLSSSSSSTTPMTTNRRLLRTLRGQLSEEERYSPQPGPIQVVDLPESSSTGNYASHNQLFHPTGHILPPSPPIRYHPIRMNSDRPGAKTKAPSNGEEADDDDDGDEVDGDGAAVGAGFSFSSRPPPSYPPPPPPSLSNKARCQSPSLDSAMPSTSATLPQQPSVIPANAFSHIYGQPQPSTSSQSKVLNYIPISECYSGKPGDRWKVDNNNENIPPPPIPPKPAGLARSQTHSSHSSLTLLTSKAEKEWAMRKLMLGSGMPNAKLPMFGACNLSSSSSNMEPEKPLAVPSLLLAQDLDESDDGRSMEMPRPPSPPIVDRSNKPGSLRIPIMSRNDLSRHTLPNLGERKKAQEVELTVEMPALGDDRESLQYLDLDLSNNIVLGSMERKSLPNVVPGHDDYYPPMPPLSRMLVIAKNHCEDKIYSNTYAVDIRHEDAEARRAQEAAEARRAQEAESQKKQEQLDFMAKRAEVYKHYREIDFVKTEAFNRLMTDKKAEEKKAEEKKAEEKKAEEKKAEERKAAAAATVNNNTAMASKNPFYSLRASKIVHNSRRLLDG